MRAWMTLAAAMVAILALSGAVSAVERGTRPSKKNPFVASSTVKVNTKATYGPEKAFDGRTDTAWCEGVPQLGTGEWVGIYLGDAALMGGPQDVTVHISRGFQKDWRNYEENGQPTLMKVELLADDKVLASAEGETKHAFAEIKLTNVPAAKGDLWIRATIRIAKPGTKYKDTCISEIRPSFSKANPHNAREFVKRICQMINKPSTKETNSKLIKLVKKIRKEFVYDMEEDAAPHCSPDALAILSEREFELWGTEGGDGATVLRFRLDKVVWALRAIGYFTALD
jgi:hypothetical protein